MSSVRWRLMALLGLVLLAVAETRAADWGTFDFHSLTRGDNAWSMRTAAGRVVDTLTFVVGENCSGFVLETGTDGHGGRGDCDLYVRRGRLPTATNFDKRSRRANYKERIFVRRPPPGKYYIRLHARTIYRTCLRIHVAKYTAAADKLFALRRCNWERDIRGIRRVVPSQRVETAAYRHLVDMLEFGYYSHVGRTPSTRTVVQRLANAGYSARAAVENIGTARLLNDQFDAWMRNSTTRARILNRSMRHLGFSDALSSAGDRLNVLVLAQPR